MEDVENIERVIQNSLGREERMEGERGQRRKCIGRYINVYSAEKDNHKV